MEKRRLSLLIGCAASTFFLMPSCVNDDYDLNKDIDMTLGVGVGITLPGSSSTSMMKMKDLLDLEDDDLVRVKEGDPDSVYYLIKGVDEPSKFEFSVDPMIVDDLEEKIFELTFEIPSRDSLMRIAGLSEQEIQSLKATGGDFTRLPNFDADSLYSSDKIELDSATNLLDYDFEMPKEVIALNYIHFEEKPMIPDFTVETTMPKGVVHMEEVYAEFPGIMVHDKFHEGGDWAYKKNTAGNHVYRLPKVTDLKYGEEPYPIGMHFVGIDMVETPWLRYQNPDGHMRLNEDIYMHGLVVIEATAKEFWEMAGDEGDVKKYSIVAKVSMKAPYIQSVDVRVNPDVEKETTVIDMDGLPDFLTDNEVTLVLKSPAIRLNTGGNFPVVIDCWGDLTTKKENNDTPLYYVTIGTEKNPEIHLDGVSGKTGWCIWDGYQPGWDTDTTKYDYYMMDGLRELLKVMPDKVEMGFDASIDTLNYFTVVVDKSYTAEVEYQVECPLALGAGSLITYADTLDGWNEDLEDFEMGTIEMNMKLLMDPDRKENNPQKVYNSPFGELDFEVTPIDVDKNFVPEVVINDGNTEGLKGLKDGAAIKLKFDCTKDEMRKLDGVILKITAKVKDDNAEPLRANSTIQLTDIGISVEGKVISDMN